MPRLILLIGLPGSGKSTLAARLQQVCPDWALISTDAIRAELFGDEAIQGEWSLIEQTLRRQLQQAATAALAGRSSVAIYDATNVRRRNRRAAIAMVRASGFQRITGIWLDTSLPLCLQRNCQRDRQVPEAVIQRMHRQLQGAPPHPSDGLDDLIRVAATGSEIPLLPSSIPNSVLS
ncbi:AAA family ATPase [Phormidium tenue FACHB-886]|nr:AAA family ATPase [Phormidium tenue FACHB-886]